MRIIMNKSRTEAVIHFDTGRSVTICDSDGRVDLRIMEMFWTDTSVDEVTAIIHVA